MEIREDSSRVIYFKSVDSPHISQPTASVLAEKLGPLESSVTTVLSYKALICRISVLIHRWIKNCLKSMEATTYI